MHYYEITMLVSSEEPLTDDRLEAVKDRVAQRLDADRIVARAAEIPASEAPAAIKGSDDG